MSKFTKELVDELADNLLIGLTEEENKLVLNEFEIIESQMDLINEIPNINNIEPLSHPFPLENISLREDEGIEGESIENVLANASDTKDREIKVPKVVGE